MRPFTTTTCDISIGLDLGDRRSYLVALRRNGELVDERRIPTTPTGIRKYFEGREPVRVVVEAGGQSAWVSSLLTDLGHDVVVANPIAAGKLLKANGRKNDRVDALSLAEYGFWNTRKLRPIRHRSRESQVDLMVLRARDSLVAQRTKAINSVRSFAKMFGVRFKSCDADNFHQHVPSELPADVRMGLQITIDQIESLTKSIKAYDQRVRELIKKHPKTNQLRQVHGVGPITALAFILILDDPKRFSRSRKVGSFLGLAPSEHSSGDSNPQLRISKAGNPFLRRLLVTAAQHILHRGPDCELRRYGERLAVLGGKRGKKRAVVAIARKLSVLLHRLWDSGVPYDPEYAQARTA
jgi:transposase